MFKKVLTLFIMLMIVGCSNNEPANFIGTVIDKKDDRILVVENVTNEEIENKSVEQILEEKAPEAIWVQVNDVKNFSIGQKVSVWYSYLEESYPAQTTADKIEAVSE
jgi:hypothetical protein